MTRRSYVTFADLSQRSSTMSGSRPATSARRIAAVAPRDLVDEEHEEEVLVGSVLLLSEGEALG
jgi:hypothetical protein